MKKLLSVVLACVLLFAACAPAALAADERDEPKASSIWFNDVPVLYLCMDKAIRGVSADFAVTLLLGDADDPDDLTNAAPIEPVRVQWVLPYPETNDRLEVWITLPESIARGRFLHYAVSGLLDAQGNPVERIGYKYPIIIDCLTVKYASAQTSELIHIFAGDMEPGDTQGGDMPLYCLQGEALQISIDPAYGEAALNKRLQVSCEGVDLTRSEDGSYTADTTGTGIVSVSVAGTVIFRVHLQVVTKQEMKSLLLKSAAGHPLNVGKAYAISVLSMNVGLIAFPPLIVIAIPLIAAEAVAAAAAFPFAYVGYLLWIMATY